jgi:ketosteroid isomerase-like protein
MRATSNNQQTAVELLERMFRVELSFLQSDTNDVSVLAEAFDQNAVVHEPASLPYGGDWRGLDQIGALFRKMREVWSDLSVEGLEAVRSDDTVFMTCKLRLTSRANASVIEQPFAEVLRFKEGRLLDGVPFYYDTSEIVAMLA